MDIAAQQDDAQQNTATRVHVQTCVTAEVVLPSRPREHRASSMGDLNGLESSEDCRGAGGHGNQHVRLRSAQINRKGRSARLPAATSCFERGFSSLKIPPPQVQSLLDLEAGYTLFSGEIDVSAARHRSSHCDRIILGQ